MFPVMLSVHGKECLVVGGGGVALRKVDSLLAEGAEVTVIATSPHQRLRALAAESAIGLHEREYTPGEAARFTLVFAATDDREVNRQVFKDADAAGVWANVADDPELCSFHLPARVRRGNLQLTVSSAGDAPFVVRRLRQLLARRLGHEWAEWLDAAGEFRRRVRALQLAAAPEERLYDRFFAATVDGETLRCRVPLPEEVASWLDDAGQVAGEARSGAREERRAPPAVEAGLVSLVGSGPGDPGLLTLRGRSRLLRADAVVYDRLAEPALPTSLPARVELHCVGKTAGNHPMPQEEISTLLIRLAREGKRVVRLKGGDPYVFGRGGEEAEALQAAGVPFETVPGVTAGVAVPAYGGIPVTHRQEAVRVTFLTAHESSKSDGPQIAWECLARDPHATLVGYMGVTSLPQVVARLVGAGLDPATPSAIIERGTTAGQRLVRAPLGELPEAAAQREVRPPALFVIGPTVRHAERLDWFARRPLAGQRLLIPAPAGELGEALELAGAEVVDVPLPLTPAARVVIAALPLSGCLVRSPDEVDLMEGERGRAGWPVDMAAWCLSEAAAVRARRLGWPGVSALDGAGDVSAALVSAIVGGERAPHLG